MTLKTTKCSSGGVVSEVAYRRLLFERLPPKNPTERSCWHCRKKESSLLVGEIGFDRHVRAYCFYPSEDTDPLGEVRLGMSERELIELRDFVHKLNRGLFGGWPRGSRKKITDEMVCEAVRDASELEPGPLFASDLLVNRTGQPQKVCLRAMERSYGRGLIECGVSLRTAWLTEKGVDLLSGSK